MKNNSSRLVYSTEAGRMCPDCRQALGQCVCKSQATMARNGNGIVKVLRQTKGRGGKTVTLVTGLALDALATATLAKQLRTVCGSGGTVKDGVIEVQGDHCALILVTLAKHGYQAKQVGG